MYIHIHVQHTHTLLHTWYIFRCVYIYIYIFIYLCILRTYNHHYLTSFLGLDLSTRRISLGIAKSLSLVNETVCQRCGRWWRWELFVGRFPRRNAGNVTDFANQWPTRMVTFSWKPSFWSINNFEPYPNMAMGQNLWYHMTGWLFTSIYHPSYWLMWTTGVRLVLTHNHMEIEAPKRGDSANVTLARIPPPSFLCLLLCFKSNNKPIFWDWDSGEGGRTDR